jgi:hypothetical protein
MTAGNLVWAFDFSYATEKPLTKASSLFIVPVLHSQQLRTVPEFISNYILKIRQIEARPSIRKGATSIAAPRTHLEGGRGYDSTSH